MKLITLLIVVVLLVSNSNSLLAQEAAYVSEKDGLVLKKLNDWQNMKFGLLMHWGPYSQWGIVESWSICSDDVDWCRRPKGISYVDYVKKYEELPKTFNPINFDPARWAQAAKDAGMRYVVFTTNITTAFRCSTQNIPTIRSLPPIAVSRKSKGKRQHKRSLTMLTSHDQQVVSSKSDEW